VIRVAERADAAEVARVHVATWQVAYGNVFAPELLAKLDAGARTAQWQRILAARENHDLVAVEHGRVVGFASLGPSRDTDAASHGELYALYVHPLHWGTGVASDLMAAAVEALQEAGFAEAILWVLEANPRARRFYEREGWRHDGGVRELEFLGRPASEVRYRRTFLVAPRGG